MFAKNLFDAEDNGQNPYVTQTGWPMEYMEAELAPYKNLKKRDLILFPHRIAPEKQVDIFKDLATRLPQYEFIVCQEQELTKHQYHTLLGEAKIVFSANLQETLGISCYEGALLDAIPLVPDRLSYTEMYHNHFKYPSIWTESYDLYDTYRPDLCNVIIEDMETYDTRIPYIQKQANSLTKYFFTATNLLANIK
jgi:hypothetical protein